MTNPQGPGAGFNRGPLQNATAVLGADGSVPALTTWDQPAAEGWLKEQHVQNNGGFNDLLGIIFQGIRAGISLPLAIIEALGKKLFGIDGVFVSVGHALDSIREVLGLDELIARLTGISGGTKDDLDAWSDQVAYNADVEAAVGVALAPITSRLGVVEAELGITP